MIDKICKRYNITNYTINDDGTIDVDGNVNLSQRSLNQLPLSFNKVTGYFLCNENELTTLKGSPKWVGGVFNCDYNELTSLEFSPEYVGGDFECYSNQLTNLVGSPKQIGRDFDCRNNGYLEDPKGCSEKLGGLLKCYNTPLGWIFNEGDQNFIHAFNFYKVIKDDTVNLKRLKYVMDLYDKRIDLKKIENYYRIV